MKISVITVCYNECENLLITLNSICEQQECDFECVIIDGGSTDGSISLLEEFCKRNENFRIASRKDNGIYDGFNKGIKAADGEYLIYMNTGDKFHNNKALKTLLNHALSNNVPVSLGRITYFYPPFDELKDDNPLLPSKYTAEFSHQALLYKKELHEIHGLYDEKYNSAADYNFFMSLKRSGIHFEKLNTFIACHGKYITDSSDTVLHTWEMMKIDFKHHVLKHTFFRRIKEIIKKIIRKPYYWLKVKLF